MQFAVSTDLELNYFVLEQEGKIFKSFYPKTFIELFGLEDINDQKDAKSRYLKSIIVKVLGPENLKEKLLCNMDEEIRKRLCLWSAKESIIDLKDSISTLFFDVIAKTLISYDPSTTTIDLMRYLKVFISSVFSFPFNFPGTAYHRSLQGRKIVMNLLKTLLSERMKSPRKESKDFLDLLVDELGKENSMLTEKSALNLIFVLLIASFVSSSQTISLATKFLSEDPKILKDLTGKPESNCGEKNYLVFGGGIRYCVGAEFSKMEMAIFLHYFVTKCKWKDVKGGNIVCSPSLEFPDGYHIQVMPKNVRVL
ncbi:cytochrome P450 87A3-like [Dendrobium catenatum]|uniref:cytochrome P450 87A3-like n=1 Tax=Dendrobium catenatum TaxID=906689 RepID=UPI0010A018A0|nr:cytochrome P450 87A3-like [Dendrobium catenatum]